MPAEHHEPLLPKELLAKVLIPVEEPPRCMCKTTDTVTRLRCPWHGRPVEDLITTGDRL